MLKKLYSSLLIKFSLIILFLLVFLYLISYALINKFFTEELSVEKYSLLIENFNNTWIIVAFVFLAFFLLGLFLVKKALQGVNDEIENINAYLEEINEKNYDAVLKVEHHLEFLQLSLHLKNIVKRLKNKKK